MNGSRDLVTPIYHKTRPDMPWPEQETMFFLLAANGLWRCRNHEFFTSSVPARHWPAELYRHEASLELRHPKIPRSLLERIVGFCGTVAARHGAEAGALFTWRRSERVMSIVVPRQTATVSRARGGAVYPLSLHYEVPSKLGPNTLLIGDVHSHAYDGAYSSQQDRRDEEYRPGLHLVIGRLNCEPPEFHCEYVVDGMRFAVQPESILEGYVARRDDFPERWLRQVTIKTYGAGKDEIVTLKGPSPKIRGDAL